MQDDLIERREELLAIKRIIVAKNARIAALEADNARLREELSDTIAILRGVRRP